MIGNLVELFIASLLISLATFGGGSQALFYQFSVTQHQWINAADLSAVLAFGYATPGPAVFGTATFIGYKIGGIAGAVIGSIGIFIVPFVLSILAAKYFGHLLKNRHMELFSRGVGLAAAGLIAATACFILNYTAASSWQIFVALGALIASLKWDFNPALILLIGGILGLFL